MRHHHQLECSQTVYKVFEMPKLDLSAEFCLKTVQNIHFQS